MTSRLIIPDRAVQDVELSPAAKLRLDRHHKSLGEQAQQRQVNCWMKDATGCSANASIHVREVGFDLRDLQAAQRVAMISSKDIEGPVPGFCAGCVANGPALLAEMLYRRQPQMRMGFKPTRWLVSFTDGSKAVGSCEQIDLHRAVFTYKDSPAS